MRWMKMKKKDIKEIIRLLKEAGMCVSLVKHDYFRDEEMLLYCAELEVEVNRAIEKLEAKL